jgi:cobalt-zinc-cadmium efflux system protein
MIIEFFTGFIAGSLALISDAIHMFTHSFALVLSLVAIILASKKAPPQKSFGYYRVEILAAFINGLTIALSVFWILYEAIDRFLNPIEIEISQSLIVAILGLVVNLITGYILMKGDRDNINLKSAFIHMLSDALSSVAIIIGLIIIYYTNLYIIDVILAILVSIVIGKWSINLLKESTHILLEGSPIEIDEVKREIEKEFSVDMHDIHIWQITHNMFNLTAHITLTDDRDIPTLLNDINIELKEHFNINHTTLQLCKNTTHS